MELSRQRGFLAPESGDDWEAIARRILPAEPLGDAVEKLKSWNLHLFARNPPGSFTGSDVVFIEAPLKDSGNMLALPTQDEASEVEGG